MTEPTEDRLLERVRKLLAKAESPACTPAEAEAFTAKAMELIAQYGIDEALLTAKDPTRDAIGDRIVKVYGPYIFERARLLQIVADNMGGKSVRRGGTNGHPYVEVHLFGYGTDLERIELIYTSLLIQAANGVGHATPRRSYSEGVRAFRTSWLRGFTAAVGQRLRESAEYARAQADAARQTGPSTALVLADRSTAVDRQYRSAYPRTRTSSSSSLAGSGYSGGHAAGMRADLGGTRIGRAGAARAGIRG